jgi:hypothetical protein
MEVMRARRSAETYRLENAMRILLTAFTSTS